MTGVGRAGRAGRVGLPINVLADRRLGALAELGVARVSCGSLLYRHALHAAVALARALAAGAVPPSGGLSYADVAGLACAHLADR